MAKTEIGGIVAKLILNDDQFRSQLAKAASAAASSTQKIATSFANISGALSASLVPAFAAATAGIYKALGAIKGVADQGDMADSIGVSVNQLQRLDYAGRMSGVALETLVGSIAKMRKHLTDAAMNGGEAAESFERLGLNVGELSRMNPVEAFGAISDAINKIENANERATLTMDIFGKSGYELAGILAEGSSGLKEFGDEAERVGYAMSELDAIAIALADDSIESLLIQTDALYRQLAAKLAPLIVGMVNMFNEWAKSIGGAANGAKLFAEIAQTTASVVLRLKHAADGVVTGLIGAGSALLTVAQSALLPFAVAVEAVVNVAISAANKLRKLRDSTAKDWEKIDLTSALKSNIKDTAAFTEAAFDEAGKSFKSFWNDDASKVVADAVANAETELKKLAGAERERKEARKRYHGEIVPRIVAEQVAIDKTKAAVLKLGDAWKQVKGTMLSVADIAGAASESSNRALAQRAEAARQAAAEAERSGRFKEADRRNAEADKLESRIKRRERDAEGNVIDRAGESQLMGFATAAQKRAIGLIKQGKLGEAQGIVDRLDARGFSDSRLADMLSQAKISGAEGIDAINGSAKKVVDVVTKLANSIGVAV